jgi:hypothetical protein
VIVLQITVQNIDEVIAAGYTVIRVYTDVSATGTFVTLDGTETLVTDTTGYTYTDVDGTSATWYKTAYYGAVPGESSKSDAQQGGTYDAYCTAFDVRQEIATGSGADSVSPKWDYMLWQMALECSRLVDGHCGLEANAFLASGSETRYVDGSGGVELWLPWPATSISAVSVDESAAQSYTSWTQGTDYFRWPYQDSGMPSGNPILRLDINRLTTGGKSVWPRRQRAVQIAGVWGYSTAVPDLVARACKTQVAEWYKLAMQGWSDTGGTPEFGQLEYPRKLDSMVMKLLDEFRRYPV